MIPAAIHHRERDGDGGRCRRAGPAAIGGGGDAPALLAGRRGLRAAALLRGSALRRVGHGTDCGKACGAWSPGRVQPV